MARARKSHKRHEEETRTTRNGLEAPYGQPGQNRYVVYTDYKRHDVETPKILVLNFRAKYAAKFFLNCLIEGDEWERCSPVGSRTGIITATGIRITMFDDLLWDLLDYEPTGAEAEWRDEQIEVHVRRLKYGVTSEDRPKRTEAEDGDDEEKPKKAKKEKKEPKPKIDKTGLVSATDIARELGVEGKDVRVVLRAMKLEKPAGGWLFDKKTAEDIREKVRKGLKEQAKKKSKK